MTASDPPGGRCAERSLVSDLLARDANYARGVFLAARDGGQRQNVHTSRR